VRDHDPGRAPRRGDEQGLTSEVAGAPLTARGRGQAAALAQRLRGHDTGLAWLHCDDSLAPLYEQVGLRRLTTHLDLRPT
jgi:broad specificity phosphatase PhoE